MILTAGQRPEELRRAFESVRRQRGVEVEVVVVGNGADPGPMPAPAQVVVLPSGVGIPAGRNAGVGHVRGELLFFLDDDAQIAEEDALARVARAFADEPELGLLQLRVKDPEGRPPPRTWVPRLRVGDPARSSEVTTVWEGAVAARRRAFDEAGGWPDHFRYCHEGVDLAWRVIDRGYRVRYAGEVVALHPAFPVARHSFSHHMCARNRVWLARRHLPLPLAVAYATAWFLATAARLRRSRDMSALLRGYRDGLRQPCGERRPLRWRTLWRMTVVGRPPIV